ncbi:MAG: hypothetical protein RL701_2793 [Pseudomonadota bacterium]
MNISFLNASATASTRTVSATATQTNKSVASAVSSDSSSKVSVSKPAELMQQLSDMQSSDPAAFAQAVTEISEQFKQLASESDGRDSAIVDKLSSSSSTDSDITMCKKAFGLIGRLP